MEYSEGVQSALATWEEMSRACLASAKLLLEEGQWRASMNRSYYAAYCAISHQLVQKRVQFPRGWNNPGHDQLPALIRNGLTLTASTRQRLLKLLRLLRQAREDADYRPHAFINDVVARDCVRDAIVVLQDMGVI